MCHLRQELCPSERASTLSLDLADSSFHFRGRDCNEAAAARSPGRNRNSFWGHQSCSSGIQPRKGASKSQHVPLREAGSAECGMIGQFILGTEPSCSDIISKGLIPFSVLDLSAVQTQPG